MLYDVKSVDPVKRVITTTSMTAGQTMTCPSSHWVGYGNRNDPRTESKGFPCQHIMDNDTTTMAKPKATFDLSLNTIQGLKPNEKELS